MRPPFRGGGVEASPAPRAEAPRPPAGAPLKAPDQELGGRLDPLRKRKAT